MSTLPDSSLFAVPGMQDLDPVVVRPTRHHGEQEGHEWVALPNCWLQVDQEYPGAFAAECYDWWADPANLERIGVGDTPNSAFSDLLEKLIAPQFADEPEDENEIQRLSDEAMDQIVLDIKEARRDAFTLITAATMANTEGTNELALEIFEQICSERYAPDSNDLLVEALAYQAARLASDLAKLQGMEPIEYVQMISLDTES